MKTVHAFFFARESADFATQHLLRGFYVTPDKMAIRPGTGRHCDEIELIVDLADRQEPAVSAALGDVGAYSVEVE